ncbi:hypothetical protein E2C01_034790 [Portunus trituberculatus]|uniref:Uncharacterized protein n=1 Tax=Portunus trituberculatus TaxID=210409 RepID=A0A5B7F7Y4_PORTR|nr:hypothetical protein [Portunus trituberculatus]
MNRVYSVKGNKSSRNIPEQTAAQKRREKLVFGVLVRSGRGSNACCCLADLHNEKRKKMNVKKKNKKKEYE